LRISTELKFPIFGMLTRIRASPRHGGAGKFFRIFASESCGIKNMDILDKVRKKPFLMGLFEKGGQGDTPFGLPPPLGE